MGKGSLKGNLSAPVFQVVRVALFVRESGGLQANLRAPFCGVRLLENEPHSDGFLEGSRRPVQKIPRAPIVGDCLHNKRRYLFAAWRKNRHTHTHTHTRALKAEALDPIKQQSSKGRAAVDCLCIYTLQCPASLPLHSDPQKTLACGK